MVILVEGVDLGFTNSSCSARYDSVTCMTRSLSAEAPQDLQPRTARVDAWTWHDR